MRTAWGRGGEGRGGAGTVMTRPDTPASGQCQTLLEGLPSATRVAVVSAPLARTADGVPETVVGGAPTRCVRGRDISEHLVQAEAGVTAGLVAVLVARGLGLLDLPDEVLGGRGQLARGP